MRYKREEAWFPLSEDILGWDQNFHQLMLNDQLRMTTYRSAIQETVKSGTIVADIGTGTGILALWALEAGAGKVYGIEINKDRAAKAIQRVENAGFGNEFEIINAISYDAKLPEKVDLIISEILGNLGDNEDMVRVLNDARRRFLKNDGRFLPKLVETYLVPVSAWTTHQQIMDKKVKSIGSAHNLGNLMDRLDIHDQFDLYYDSIIPLTSYLSKPSLTRKFNFDGNDEAEYQTRCTFMVGSDGLFTGFKGYFIAQLSEHVYLNISGDDIEGRQTSDCLKHCYLPVKKTFEVKVGDMIELIFARKYPLQTDSPFRQCYQWSGTIYRNNASVHTFEQKTC